jgi:hypothetical protein
MLGDAIPAIRAVFQRSDCKSMPERMGRRPPPSSSARQVHLLNQGLECGLDVPDQQWLSPQGDKNVVVKWGIRAAQF